MLTSWQIYSCYVQTVFGDRKIFNLLRQFLQQKSRLLCHPIISDRKLNSYIVLQLASILKVFEEKTATEVKPISVGDGKNC